MSAFTSTTSTGRPTARCWRPATRGSGPDSIFACLGQGACDGVTSRVAKIISNSLAKEEIVHYPSNDHIILGTVGIQVGDEIWVGGVGGGERIGRFPAP